MNLYRKLDCVCGHEYDTHSSYGENKPCYSKEIQSPLPVCPCTKYDPAGHNPELENVLCPQCRLARLENSSDKIYMCPQCQHVMFESQVLEMVG